MGKPTPLSPEHLRGGGGASRLKARLVHRGTYLICPRCAILRCHVGEPTTLEYRRNNHHKVHGGAILPYSYRRSVVRKSHSLEAKDAMSEWLRSMDWDMMGTHTFKRPPRDPYHCVRMAAEFLTHWEHKIDCAFIVAQHNKLGGTHGHSLIKWARTKGREQPLENHLEARWDLKHGFGRFRRAYSYQAADYIARYVNKESLDWRLIGNPVYL